MLFREFNINDMAMKPEPFRGPIMDGPTGRYHPPLPVEFRIYHLNKRLQEASYECDNIWWDEMISEFFEDNASLSISMLLEEGPKHYTIGRVLIPRFFRSFYNGGASELYFVTRHSKELLNHATHSITMDSAHTTMISQYNKSFPVRICTDGHLTVEFSCDQFTRIRHWNFEIRGNCELILRQTLLQDSRFIEKFSNNITRCGINPATMNHLRLSSVLEPMTEIMSRYKECKIDPRDCLRNCLFQKWNRMMNPPEPVRGGKTTRRKRKPSATASANQSLSARKKTAFSASDVMVVGEPSIMGGDIGEEDERLITRLENQFDRNVTGIKSESNDIQNPTNFPHTTSPAIRQNMNSMSQWPQGQPIPSQGRPPSQTGTNPPVMPSSLPPGPGSQTPSRPEDPAAEVMPSTPSSSQN